MIWLKLKALQAIYCVWLPMILDILLLLYGAAQGVLA